MSAFSWRFWRFAWASQRFDSIGGWRRIGWRMWWHVRCPCGNPDCRGASDAEYHICGGPREACGIAGCPECGTTRWRAFRWWARDNARRLRGLPAGDGR